MGFGRREVFPSYVADGIASRPPGPPAVAFGEGGSPSSLCRPSSSKPFVEYPQRIPTKRGDKEGRQRARFAVRWKFFQPFRLHFYPYSPTLTPYPYSIPVLLHLLVHPTLPASRSADAASHLSPHSRSVAWIRGSSPRSRADCYGLELFFHRVEVRFHRVEFFLHTGQVVAT